MTTQEGVRLWALLNKWRAYVEALEGPTDRIIGVETCADELESLLKKLSALPA
jgi:hypothetical protein